MSRYAKNAQRKSKWSRLPPRPACHGFRTHPLSIARRTPLAAGFFVPIFVKIIIFAGQTPNFVI